MSVTYRASINNLPDKSRSSAGRTVHEGHGNRNGTDEVIRTDNGSNQSHLLCPVLLLLFITEIILLLTLLYSSLLYSTGFHWLFPLYWWAFQRFVHPSPNTLIFVSFYSSSTLVKYSSIACAVASFRSTVFSLFKR
mgnify:FL=1